MVVRVAVAAAFLCAGAWAQTCTFAYNPASVSAPATETAGVITVTASSSNCERTATTETPWITISFGHTGTGNGTVGYRVQANRDALPRQGAIRIAGTTISFSQAPAVCPFTLTPGAAAHPLAGSQGSFSVSTPCNWQAVPNADWIRVTNTSGTGNATINYSVSANGTGQARTGEIRVGTAVFRVAQQGPSCAFTLDPVRAAFPSPSASAAFAVTSGCPWTAVSNAPWITVTAGASGTGNGTVSYSIGANAGAQTRTGTITVGTATFTVTQSASGCTVTITPQSANAPSGGITGAIAVSSSCAWSAATSDPWIRITSGATGSGNGVVNYVIDPNTGAAERSGAITIANQSFAVRQAGGGCALTVTPAALTIPAAGGVGTLNIAGPCAWTAVADAGWIVVTPQSGQGPAVLNYVAGQNATGRVRTGSLRVGAETIALTQFPYQPRFTAASIVNAASFRGGSVAPGLIATIFGADLGPDPGAPFEITEDGTAFRNSVAGLQVFFDGVPAPVVYAFATQTSVIVPYSVAGRRETRVEAVYQGSRSGGVLVPVVGAAPAVFTQNASGTGPGAILHADFSLNTAENPVPRGGVIQIFATGGGQLVPPGADGAITTSLSATELPVAVTIGGRPAQVLYAGTAPGLVSGVLQINAFVPEDAAPGAAELIVTVGEFSSPAGVTVAIQ